MPFPTNVRMSLLVRSGRRCCLCWTYCGVKIQVHHIVPENAGGSDEEGNGIPLCLNCHAEVRAYDDQHPIGTKFHPAELRQHRDRLFRWIEQGGPVVFDLLKGQAVAVSPEALIREEPPSVGVPVDLSHEAKLARYLRYLRHAERHKDQSQFQEAIRGFESAFLIAESDSDIADYAAGGNYHLRKLLLWECYLESFAHENTRDHLYAAVNMDVDESTIQQTFYREGLPGSFSCREYFYLLLQESLFLFDEEIGHRKPTHQRLARLGDLMDLIENPHCPQKSDDLIRRAQEIERDVVTRLRSRFPGERYPRIP
jgi:hypothetical protein